MKAHVRLRGATLPAGFFALAATGALSILGTLAIAAPARAATATPDTAHYQVAPIIVTALAPTSPLTFVADLRAPRQPVPANDAADYLRSIPGFASIRNGGTNGDPVLRGMYGSRLNVLQDGACMLGACPARMDAPSSYIAPESFDVMTVIKGPQTVEWGPGASAGTVRFEHGVTAFESPGVRVRSQVLGGSWGRNDQLVDIIGGESFGDARVDLQRSEAGDYADGEGAVVPSRWRKWNVDALAGWRPSSHARVELRGGTGDGYARYAGRSMDGTKFRRQSLGASARVTPMDGPLRELEAQVAWHDADHVMDNYSLRTPDPMSMMSMPGAAEVNRRSLSARAAGTLRLGAMGTVVAGADLRQDLHRGRWDWGIGTYEAARWDDDARTRNFGGFAEWTARPHSALTSVVGARLDAAAVKDLRAVDAMMMDNPTHGETRRERLGSAFARMVGVWGTHGSAFAGLGHSERMPDYWEMFSPNAGPDGSVNAFAGVRPERTTQFDVGAQWAAGGDRAWVSAYAGQVRNFILFTYTGGMMGMSSTVENIEARTHGFEAGLAHRQGHVMADGSLAWAWGRDVTNDAPLPQVPPLEGRMTLQYDDGVAWSGGVLVRAVATQDRIALDRGNVVGRDLGRTPGFGILSFNLARRLPLGMTLAAGVDNVLDRTYSEHLNLAGDSAFGYPADPVRIHEPGRTAWLKLNLKS